MTYSYSKTQQYFKLLILLWAVSGCHLANSKGVYLTNEEFLLNAFNNDNYTQKTLWLSGDTKKNVQALLDRKQVPLRQRYWVHQNKTAWIMNEIGKELPITIGVVIENNSIQQINVLEYRESRGGEVRHSFFTKQFIGSRLEKNDLDNTINGITGATLSVWSMQRVAKAALYLHNKVAIKNSDKN